MWCLDKAAAADPDFDEEAAAALENAKETEDDVNLVAQEVLAVLLKTLGAGFAGTMDKLMPALQSLLSATATPRSRKIGGRLC
jgi:hypothetical protein